MEGGDPLDVMEVMVLWDRFGQKKDKLWNGAKELCQVKLELNKLKVKCTTVLMAAEDNVANNSTF